MGAGIAIYDFGSGDVDPAVPASAERLLQSDIVVDNVHSRLRQRIFLIEQAALCIEDVEEIFGSGLELIERQRIDLRAIADDFLELGDAQSVLIERDACIFNIAQADENFAAIVDKCLISLGSFYISISQQLASLENRK